MCPREFLKKLALDDGSAVVLEDWSQSLTGNNVYRLKHDGSVAWTISPPPGVGAKDTFTNIYWCDGELFAYRESGGEYKVDVESGRAMFSRELK